MVILLILLAIPAVAVLRGVGPYNGLITSRNGYRNAFAQVDVQLQRRFDHIPNLVETAKGYLKHERETLDAVVSTRGAAQSGLAAAKASPGHPAAMATLAATQAQLKRRSGPSARYCGGVPGYEAQPDMMQLIEELTSTENKVAFAQQAFDNAVLAFSNKREVFPSSVIARIFEFPAAIQLAIPADKPEMRDVPKMQFRLARS